MRGAGALIGCTGYRAFGEDHAELGYWIGKPYWGMGYASEAVRALILHAFETGGFAYLTAGHFTRQSGLGADHRQVRLHPAGNRRRARLRARGARRIA